MTFPFKSILCPIDFDDNSVAALDRAIELASHFKSTLILMHVLPLVVALGEIPPPRALYEDQEKAARAKLEDIAKSKLSGLKHESLLYTGDIVTCILDAQQKYQPDLVVIATHGRGGIAHLVLGSVAEGVVRKAGCPVLTIRGTSHGKSEKKS
ncbi:MAG TPA: universal stress protein [Candidatus Binataceae bacterium]|nr:universal stress protein [Candidatus Binataceae bacterium]